MRYLFTIFFIVLSASILAQNAEHRVIDSLLKKLSTTGEDTNKVKVQAALATEYSHTNPDEGIKYGKPGLELAMKLDWEKGSAMAANSLAACYQAKADYPDALVYDLKALKNNETLGNKEGIASNLSKIGSVYWYESNFPQALEYYFKSLKLYEELNDKKGISKNLDNIGEVYAHQNNYPKALENYFKALAINQALNDQSNIGRNLGEIGEAYAAQNDYPKALEYDFKSLALFKSQGNKIGIAYNMGSIGNVYQSQKNYSKSLEYYFSAYNLFNELDDKYGIAVGLGNIGETYLIVARDSALKIKADSLIPAGKAANLRKSVEYLDKSVTLFRQIGVLDAVISYSKALSEAYKLSGDYKKALENYTLYATLDDSVNSNSNKIKIANLETTRELGLKEKQIEIDKLEVSKERNERVFFIAGIVLLLMVIVFVFRNYRTQKQSNRLLSIEKKRSDDLLLNILPVEVADELKATGGAVAKYFDDVTVMFTDFVNFTEAGERMNPQQLIDELHACFKAFDGIIDKYNIEKIKTIGDAYLAVSGLPVPDAAHAANIVKAAIEINDFMTRRKQQIGDKTFEVRIGIHSGSVVAGIVGVKKFAYDVWGDTVNTAARMEENSEAGKINISHTTYTLVHNQFNCKYRGEIQAKNKGQLRMYFVEG